MTEKRTRGAPCSFKCKQGLRGRKRQECQIDGEKDESGAMQFQVQARALGKKTSGRQSDGEKENKSLNCQTYFPFGLKIRNVVFLNSIIMMLVCLRFSCIPQRLSSAVLEVIGGKNS